MRKKNETNRLVGHAISVGCALIGMTTLIASTIQGFEIVAGANALGWLLLANYVENFMHN